MNILVVAHYQNDGSPSAIFIHEQAKAYAALGHTVRVIVPVAIGKRGYQTAARLRNRCTLIDGIPHFYVRYLSLSRYGVGGFNTRSAISALKRHYSAVLADFIPDVIHAHTLGFDSDLGAWLKGRLSVPLVVTTHGSDASVPYERGQLDWLREKADRADTVVAVSSVLANKIRASGTATPVRTILNGFALSAMPESCEKVPYSVLQVGHLIAQKRVDITLRAFAKLREHHPSATLTVIGQGSERERLETLCAQLGIAQAVRFTGQLPNRDVLAEMAQAQFFCMPSVREGFGIVYLEAMASGCITIGTQGEGIADLIVSEKNGFLVPPDHPDAIAEVMEWCLAHPGEADAIAEQGRRDAMGLTWERNAAAYIQLFQSLTSK